MVFSSILFLFFFLLIVLALYFNPIWKGRQFRNTVLFLASLGFYAWGEPYFVFIMMASIILNWALGLAMSRSEGSTRKICFLLALLVDFGLLFVFKYLVFFASNLSLLLHRDWTLQIALPIGISFYTFQIASYIIDLYRSKVQVQKSVFKLGLYIAMFPQLIAGPIVRYETIAEEIDLRRENWEDFSEGTVRFLLGLGKKVLLANNIALLVDKTFSAASLSVGSAWLGAIAYTLQIYFDFSGYSDMAIGLGRMFGFHFNENFDHPYLASSVTDFWRRWHISLSTWFRDYVYIPLGGSRVAAARHIFNLFVVWSLTGLWHGANWTFILWGILYFLIQVIEKYLLKQSVPRWLGHVYTLVIVICCWVIFRADNLSAAMTYLGRMFGIGANGFWDAAAAVDCRGYLGYLLLGAICSFPLCTAFKGLKERGSTLTKSVMNVSEIAFYCLVLLLSVAQLLASNYNPFIYFNF